MPFYRKKPIEIEAHQFFDNDRVAVERFVPVKFLRLNMPEGVFQVYDDLHETWISFSDKDWIIKGIQHEYYPCKQDVFKNSYVLITEE